MKTIKNPILKGFNPDPSILRVNNDYYIATSTFEWFPGVQIHHSKDLKNWRLITRPLDRLSQLNMIGNCDSGGIWAPCLTYSEGVFYLIYTDVKCWRVPYRYKDCHNYLVTSTDITGAWSDPVFLNSSGFDPSLFHDDNGKKWLTNMLWDFRKKDMQSFSGILLQEYDSVDKKLKGPIKKIFGGTEIGLTEGSHIYKRNGYYYLMTAEGGTGYEHAVTMARSKHIEGPYEVDPENPILTSSENSEIELQKAGHASIVETQNGDWYMVHLCGRPVGKEKMCILGRETAIQKCKWTDDDWFRLIDGNNIPKEEVIAPNLPECEFEKESEKDDFESENLNIHFQFPRIPASDNWLSLKERTGFLRIYGQESLSSRHHQSLVARRVQSFECEITTCIEFNPVNFQQMAGLTMYYDVNLHYYLFISYDEKYGKHLNIFSLDCGEMIFPIEPISIDGSGNIFLKAVIDYEILQFSYSEDGKNWIKAGPALDATKISDDYKYGKFTGAFIGMCVQDMSGQHKYADFDFFEYKEKQNNNN